MGFPIKRPGWISDLPVRRLRAPRWAGHDGTWREAKPAVIEAARQRAAARRSGNWFVLAGSREITTSAPFGRTIAGVELVAWRTEDGRLHVGPGACPHLGAPLSQARVHCGQLICRWHGLKLGEHSTGRWTPFPAYDDGVLAWVRLDAVAGETPLAEPVVPTRPRHAVSIGAVATAIGVCEPEDVVANRLDPWHGAWFHPYSFANLRVVDAPSADGRAGTGEGGVERYPDSEAESDAVEADRFDVEVTFRLSRRFGVPVLARFTAPEPRTVVMRIVDGEGAGSVVETHATPLGTDRFGDPKTAVIEATVAHSPRRGFQAARKAAVGVRPVLRWVAQRLWRDDLAYAERRCDLRRSGRSGRWTG